VKRVGILHVSSDDGVIGSDNEFFDSITAGRSTEPKIAGFRVWDMSAIFLQITNRNPLLYTSDCTSHGVTGAAKGINPATIATDE
jgi:hypothetical protein